MVGVAVSVATGGLEDGVPKGGRLREAERGREAGGGRLAEEEQRAVDQREPQCERFTPRAAAKLERGPGAVWGWPAALHCRVR